MWGLVGEGQMWWSGVGLSGRGLNVVEWCG